MNAIRNVAIEGLRRMREFVFSCLRGDECVLLELRGEAGAVSAGGSGGTARTQDEMDADSAPGWKMSAAVVLGRIAANGKNENRPRCVESVTSGTAFYRKYTEQLLRRYMRTSMEMGRSPSVLGNFVFRGKACHTGIRNFEDAVIFVHDVESCLKKLNDGGRELIARIALEDYTQVEVADMQGASVRTVMRRYADTLDKLTEILLEVDLLKVPAFGR